MTISVVVPVFNRRESIQACLNSVAAQSHPALEIIVVDDGSSDNTIAVVEQCRLEHLVLVRHHRNRGLAAARNSGLRQSRGELVAFIDSDCTADKDWLKELVSVFQGDRNIMVAGGRSEDEIPTTYWQRVHQGSNFIALRSVYAREIRGCNMALRKSLAEEIMFDERNPWPAADDLDICLRVIRRGYRVFYAHAAVVRHTRRPDWSGSIYQAYLYGVGNAYARLKNKAFPFVNLTTLVFVFGVLGGIVEWAWSGRCLVAPSMLFGLFLAAAFLIDVRRRTKSLSEIFWTLPGSLILLLAQSVGNIHYYLGKRPPKRATDG